MLEPRRPWARGRGFASVYRGRVSAEEVVTRSVKQALYRVGFEVRRTQGRNDLEKRLWPRNARDERHLKAILAARLTSRSNCIDVGAFEGRMVADMVRLAPEGRHLAFEPIPKLAASLRAQFPSIEVHEVALSDRSGTAEFGVVPDSMGLSGFSPSVSQARDTERIAVEIRALDDFIGDTTFDVLKIDVEGAELGVFRGAAKLLGTARPLIAFEHTRVVFDVDGATLGAVDLESNAAIFELLDGLGYRLFDLDGIGPLGEAEFRRWYETAERFNFIAVPS